MTSTIAWLDYSERDRRRALDVVDLLREPSTVDELGLGTIRDAFAEVFFPGTTTIQTQARYFLFVPWIYKELERLRVTSRQIATRARTAEVALIEALIESGEREGVIGRQARKALKRLPSNIYWNGLSSWRIRKFQGTQPQYHRSLDLFYESPRAIRDEDENPAEGKAIVNWDPEMPKAPRSFPKSVSLDLTHDEAEYLRERIILSHPHSLLALLVDHAGQSSVDFVWEHPDLVKVEGHLKEQLEHARLFSEAMLGAQLLYNVMLAEAIGNDDWSASFRQALSEWADVIRHRASAFRAWDVGRFWAIVEAIGFVRQRTHTFVDRWLGLALEPDAAAVISDIKEARELVRHREEDLKGARARLQNRQALLLWQGGSGSAQLDFRWSVAQRIINDVLEGLRLDA